MYTISSQDLTRFEQDKEQFKQQVCFGVDKLFQNFLASINPVQLQKPLTPISSDESNINYNLFLEPQNEASVTSQQPPTAPLCDLNQIQANISAPNDELFNSTPSIASYSSDASIQNETLHLNYPRQNTRQQTNELHSPLTSLDVKQEISGDFDEQIIDNNFINAGNADNHRHAFQVNLCDNRFERQSDYHCLPDASQQAQINENLASKRKNLLSETFRSAFRIPILNVPKSSKSNMQMPNSEIQISNVASPSEIHSTQLQSASGHQVSCDQSPARTLSYPMDENALLLEIKAELEEERQSKKKARIDDFCSNEQNAQCSGNVKVTVPSQIDSTFEAISSNSSVFDSISSSATFDTISNTSFSTHSEVCQSPQQTLQNEASNEDHVEHTQTLESNVQEIEEGELLESESESLQEVLKIISNINNQSGEVANEIRKDFIKAVCESREEDISVESCTTKPDDLEYFPPLDYDKFQVLGLNCTLEGCLVTFQSKEELEFHLAGAHTRWPYQCPLNCHRMSFVTRLELLHHFQLDHFNESRLICLQCGQRMDSLPALHTHMIEHHHQGRFACVHHGCHNVALFREAAIRHYDNVHASGHCTNIAQRKATLRLNISNESDDSQSVSRFRTIGLGCIKDDCPLEFSKYNELESHLRDLHGSWPFACPMDKCDQSFRSKVTLINHVGTEHQQVKTFQCSKCDFVHDNFETFNKHNYMNHLNGQFKCTKENCGFVGKCRSDTLKHYYIKHKRFAPCPFCGLTTKSQLVLKDHQCNLLTHK